MENFEAPHNKVKEKSLYVLHLDTVRIVLISAAVIGIVVVSFLLGMNFMRPGGGEPSAMENAEVQKDLDILKGSVPPQEEEYSKASDAKGEPSAKENVSVDNTGGSEQLAKNESVDLTGNGGSNSSFIKGSAPVKRKSVERKNDDRKTVTEKKSSRNQVVAKKTEKNRNNSIHKKSRKKVIEAAGVEEGSAKETSGSGYSIQVGSLDSKDKAMAQVKELRAGHFNARLDKTTVDGKRVYRVRIGPIAQKKKALATLRKLQESDRYDDSYLIRD